MAHNLRQKIQRALRRLRGARPLSDVSERQVLIERKAAVQAEIAQARLELSNDRPGSAARPQIEARLELLMAEEHHLRLLIDRAPHNGD